MIISEHFFHYILMGIPLSFGIFVFISNLIVSRHKNFFQHSSKFTLLTLFILVLFLSTHTSPLNLFASHHQRQGAAYHPCCIPQAATVISSITFIILLFAATKIVPPSLVADYCTANQPINNKSPPIYF